MATRDIEPFVRSPETAGVFLDFDGTLSEIVLVPSDARPRPEVPDLMHRLRERFALVAIVSGRSARQLVEWLGDDLEIWGVHGAERAVDGRVVASDSVTPYLEIMEEARRDAGARLEEAGIPGTVLEDKGAVIGLHFRAAEDREAARRALDEIAEDLCAVHGLVRASGRLAFELRPPVELSKEQVVLARSRGEGLQGVMYVGDDRVDIPAFAALDQLEAEGVATLRVAVRSDEAPEALIERADLVVEGPAGVVELLERLASS